MLHRKCTHFKLFIASKELRASLILNKNRFHFRKHAHNVHVHVWTTACESLCMCLSGRLNLQFQKIMHDVSFWNCEAVKCILTTIAAKQVCTANFFNLSMHLKFISRISREVLTCYISSLESISRLIVIASKAINMLHAIPLSEHVVHAWQKNCDVLN